MAKQIMNRISDTAQFIAFNRALGTLAPQVPGFSDPVARLLLPDKWARKVEQAEAGRAKVPPRSPFPFWLRGMGLFNQFRTVVLDRAIDSALPVPQLVILGAGLDGRAWRMTGLNATSVFEVDHPDTQAWKRERSSRLQLAAGAIRFVPADLRTDVLAARLAEAGHDSRRPSFWLCEGVAMYLALEEVVRLLAGTAALAGAGSRLALTYLGKRNGRMPASLLHPFLDMAGEPVRSAFAPAELAAATEAAGWRTVADSGIEDWKRELAPTLALTENQVGLQWSERIWVGQKSG
jgi:methyltransferase (TIGR00027 family)